MTKDGVKMSVDINEYEKYKERRNMTNELKETGDFEGYMLEILDLLENGDAAIDFAERDQEHEATVIRIIASIVRDELHAIETGRRIDAAFAFYGAGEEE